MWLRQSYYLCSMSLYIASLNSGSNGNCYYVGNENEAVLIDAGISCREIEKRLKRLELPLEKIKAVFISHEHGDHIHGVAAFSKKHKVPVYITPATYRAGNLQLEEMLIEKFESSSFVTVGDLQVRAFPKQHDAVDPCSFVISHSGINVGVFTDIGKNCERVIASFKQCHAVFLEANYDEEMLEKGSYPLALKNRIRTGYGHLSNTQAMRLVADHRPPFMSHLFLSHLSRNNNSPERAMQAFATLHSDMHISIAPRERETEVFFIDGSPVPISIVPVLQPRAKVTQLSLF